jgi:hypothetical protein
MKREVSREKALPAFSLDLDDLELLRERLLDLFSQENTVICSIDLKLKRESLEFTNVEELRSYKGLRGRVTDFRLSIFQLGQRVSVRSGYLLDSKPYVSATSSSEAWCAGAIETASSFLHSKRQWYFWFVSWPIAPILVVFGNIPLLARMLLPRTMHIQGMALGSWSLMMIALVVLYFTKGSLLPSASIIITREEGFLRRHIGELSLLVAIASAVLTVIGLLSGK